MFDSTIFNNESTNIVTNMWCSIINTVTNTVQICGKERKKGKRKEKAFRSEGVEKNEKHDITRYHNSSRAGGGGGGGGKLKIKGRSVGKTNRRQFSTASRNFSRQEIFRF